MTTNKLKDLIKHNKNNPLNQIDYETLNEYHDNKHIPIIKTRRHKYERS